MCEAITIASVVIGVAGAVKQSMDARSAASAASKNAIAQQKIDQEAFLQDRAARGDATAMAALEKSRQARVDAARIKAALGEKGASAGSFQIDNMLQGLGFSTGLQVAGQQRTAEREEEARDLSLRASGINFTNRMRSIRASTPSAGSTLLNAGIAGTSGFVEAGGSFEGLFGSDGSTSASGVNVRRINTTLGSS
jgi:hypothetical protein